METAVLLFMVPSSGFTCHTICGQPTYRWPPSERDWKHFCLTLTPSSAFAAFFANLGYISNIIIIITTLFGLILSFPVLCHSMPWQWRWYLLRWQSLADTKTGFGNVDVTKAAVSLVLVRLHVVFPSFTTCCNLQPFFAPFYMWTLHRQTVKWV